MKPVENVFGQTYDYYLAQIRSLSLEAVAGPLGGRYHDGVLEIALFNETYTLSPDGIFDPFRKKPGFDTCVILSRYLLMCPKEELPEKSTWVSFRDFRDSGPLTVYFAQDIEKQMADRFSGRIADLEKAAAAVGGSAPEIEVTYDLAVRFQALPRIGMLLLFNEADDEFDAGCSVLFESHTEKYLDAECIAMLGGQLVRRLSHPRPGLDLWY